jgi:hypothetical protein
MWLTSSLLVGALAVHREDMVFIILQLSTVASATVILFLAHKYRGMACEAHAHAARHRPRCRRRSAGKGMQRGPLDSAVSIEPVARAPSSSLESHTAPFVRRGSTVRVREGLKKSETGTLWAGGHSRARAAFRDIAWNVLETRSRAAPTSQNSCK